MSTVANQLKEVLGWGKVMGVTHQNKEILKILREDGEENYIDNLNTLHILTQKYNQPQRYDNAYNVLSSKSKEPQSFPTPTKAKATGLTLDQMSDIYLNNFRKAHKEGWKLYGPKQGYNIRQIDGIETFKFVNPVMHTKAVREIAVPSKWSNDGKIIRYTLVTSDFFDKYGKQNGGTRSMKKRKTKRITKRRRKTNTRKRSKQRKNVKQK